MSTEPSKDLDFETADFQDQGQATASCVVCKTPIATSYWEANGQLVCERCRHALEQEFGGKVGAGLYLRGALLGGGAALVGAIGWNVMREELKSEWGIIAIAIGWLVGKAVSIGTRRRGGPPARAMALGFAYLAMTSPYLLGELLGAPPGEEAAAFGRALIGPFTEGFSNIIGIAILAFGLLQAWQTSAPVSLEIRGPFRLNRHQEADGVG